VKLRVQITKERGIRFISHLEYQKTIEKAIRRARIPVAYSQGFNPHMRFSLASALGVGVTSQCEFMELKLREERPLSELMEALSANLPMGIHVIAADLADDKAPKLMARAAGASYHVSVPCSEDPAPSLKTYETTPEVTFTKKHTKSKGKPRTIDVKEFISELHYAWDGKALELTFDCKITPTGSMKAREFLQVLMEQFGLALNLDAADIGRTDLYARDAGGRKVPLLAASKA
jgi:radical SAM-linked protein